MLAGFVAGFNLKQLEAKLGASAALAQRAGSGALPPISPSAHPGIPTGAGQAGASGSAVMPVPGVVVQPGSGTSVLVGAGGGSLSGGSTQLLDPAGTSIQGSRLLARVQTGLAWSSTPGAGGAFLGKGWERDKDRDTSGRPSAPRRLHSSDLLLAKLGTALRRGAPNVAVLEQYSSAQDESASFKYTLYKWVLAVDSIAEIGGLLA